MLFLYRQLSRLPFAVLYTLASLLYFMAFYVVRYRRKVVDKNLRHALPELDEQERKALTKRFYRGFSETMLEVVKGYTLPLDQLKTRFQYENIELLERYIADNQSVLLLGIHQGNWEWLIQSLPPQLNCQVQGVYKRLHGDTGDKIFYDTRARFGMDLVPFDEAMRKVIRGRKSLRVFSMMADQAPISREKRYWMNFLNKPAPFYYGPQMIAEATQYPVVFAHIRRVSRGHYLTRFETISEAPHARGGDAVLKAYIQCAERSIREQPESFLWSNKKWRSPKPGELEKQQQAFQAPPGVTEQAG